LTASYDSESKGFKWSLEEVACGTDFDITPTEDKYEIDNSSIILKDFSLNTDYS